MNYQRLIRSILNRNNYVKELKRKVRFYEERLFVAPGHFYSPIVDSKEAMLMDKNFFKAPKCLYGIDLNKDCQLAFLEDFLEYYKLLPFCDEPELGNRYYYNNNSFSFSDAVFLFSMVMHVKPQKIIEIGSGFSSAAMLDINEQFFGNAIDLTFIEPFPENLMARVKEGDQFTLIEKKVQQVDHQIFEALKEDDILFIDSTHVAKTGSDVLFELFEILPRLKKGVKIHLHDVFYPFEYPKEWVIDQKRSWNEIYFLRAFLMYNTQFRIIAFNTYLEQIAEPWFRENMPLCLKNPGGSIWLEKVA